LRFSLRKEQLMMSFVRWSDKKVKFVRFICLFATLLILISSPAWMQRNHASRGALLAQSHHVSSPDATPLFLVQTINTAEFSPPSPDPSGITYIPTTNLLWISDGEVDEMPALYEQVNLFGVTLAGILVETENTRSFSNEPNDLAYNPNNEHIFYSDDNVKRIFEVNPGADGVHGNGDDTVTSFSTTAFGAVDPEGLAYDAASGDLFISASADNEVFRVDAGANGIFDGVAASGGDDIVTSFDTEILNILHPQGIDFDAASGNLVLVGRDPTQIYEVTTTGALVRTLTVNVPGAHRFGSVVLAPGSKNSTITNYYVVDRGVDNNYDPDENDGRIYEFTLMPNAPTSTPLPTSTPPPPTRTPTNTPVVAGDTSTPTNTPTNTPTALPNATPTPRPTGTLDGDNEIFLPRVSS
jgi:hypothetical protein